MAYRNHLLCALGEAPRAALVHHATPLIFPPGRNLQPQDGPKETTYFIEEGLVSLSRLSPDGSRLESSLVGREGLVGLPQVPGVRSVLQAGARTQGMCLAVPTEILRRLIAQWPDLADVTARYTQLLLDEARLTAACNAIHSLEQRLAKWLLLAVDSGDYNGVAVTHEELSEILGVQRTSITAVLGKLQTTGAIRALRGFVEPCDKPLLQAISCHCYSEITHRFEALGLPLPSERSACD